MPICLQKPSCRQQNPLLAGGNNRKSLLPTNSSRPLFNQIAIFSGILTEHFNCKCFLLYTCELLEISPSGKDISLSIMTSRILASVHEQEPVKNWSRRTLIYNTVLHFWTCPRSGAHLLPRSVTRVMYRSNRSFNIPPAPRHPQGIWHLFPGEEGIWLSESSSRGWGIWSPCVRGGEYLNCTLDLMWNLEISGEGSCHEGRGVGACWRFSWKRLCLYGQLVTRFVPYLKVFKF